MNTCKLHLFTWIGSGKQEEHSTLRPICPTHPEAQLKINVGVDKRLVVTCPEQGEHLVTMCSQVEFEAEKQQARELLEKLVG